VATLSRRIAQVRALPWRQRRALVCAVLLAPGFALALRLLGLRPFRALIGAGHGSSGPNDMAVARELGEAVNTAARFSIVPVSCLARSLLLKWWLQRRGIAADLRLGARRVEGRLDAHAWVECQGSPVNDQADVALRFAAFPPSPQSSARAGH
jgi:hypothetical protein